MKYYLLVVLLSGCSAFSEPSTINMPAPKERVIRIDERLMTECEQLTNLKDNPKPSEVLLQHGQDVKKYADCAEGKRKLIDALRKVFPKE